MTIYDIEKAENELSKIKAQFEVEQKPVMRGVFNSWVENMEKRIHAIEKHIVKLCEKTGVECDLPEDIPF